MSKMNSFDFNIAIEEDGDEIFTKMTYCNQFNCRNPKTGKYPKLVYKIKGKTKFHICPNCGGSFNSWPVK